MLPGKDKQAMAMVRDPVEWLRGTARTALPIGSRPRRQPFQSKAGKSRSAAWNGPIGAKLDRRRGKAWRRRNR